MDGDVCAHSHDLISVLERRSGREGERPFVTISEEGRDVTVSYADLARQARQVAHLLRRHAKPGDRALILHQTSVAFVAAMFGCFYADVIATPLYPNVKREADAARASRRPERLQALVDCARPSVVFADGADIDRLRLLTPDLDATAWIDAGDLDPQTPEAPPRDASPHDPAVLQFTSGSTSDPRGVLVTHHNLMTNLDWMHSVAEAPAGSTIVSWLPLYHDMGLITGPLYAAFAGLHAVLMRPAAFLRRPLAWLQTLERHKAYASGGPNFAFEHCLRRIADKDLAKLDLSCLKRMLTGAEQIRPATLERFETRFAAAGFSPDAWFPCYGLAEATLLVAGRRRALTPTHRHFDPAGLEQGVARSTTPSEGRALASCGQVVGRQTLRIVDPVAAQMLPEGRVGEVWISSDAVAQGYWRAEDAHRQTFEARLADGEGPFLRTGDLGFLLADELFITGRLKDLIICDGRNIAPHDIERAVEAAHPEIVRGGCAAFAIERDGSEAIVVIAERERGGEEAAEAVAAAVRRSVMETEGVPLAEVVLTTPGRLPRTSSGKLQRAEARRTYLEDQRPAAAPPGEVLSSDQVLRRILAAIAEATGRPSSAIDPATPFADLGLGSRQALSLLADLEGQLAAPIGEVELYDHPTPQALAHWLCVGRHEAPRPALARLPPQSLSEPLAIVGMACRFPGAADLSAYWTLVRSGGVAVSSTEHRPGAEQAPAYPTAGLIEDLHGFDAAAFGLAPAEARTMDPQQRLLLEIAYDALDDAGLRREALAGSRAGVFVGACGSDFSRLAQDGGGYQLATGGAASIIANRISYVLDLRGPSLTVDTACSSSLSAAHLALASLRRGECDLALVGGVNALLDFRVTNLLGDMGALSPQGACRPFAAAADGYVRGEGAGVIVLRRLADAVRDGDRIYALLQGAACNQDGSSNGLTAPNPEAQRQVLTAALADAGLSAHQVAYVEAHGTGTPLGDPIEVAALADVLGPRPQGTAPCMISSVKGNIGHLEAAAGIAGLIKTALALAHGEIPPQPAVDAINPRLEPYLAPCGTRSDAPLRLPLARQAWPEGQRFAGVSSFGFGGTNVHVLLAAAPTPAPATDAAGAAAPYLLPVAGATPDGLTALAAAYARATPDDDLAGFVAEVAHHRSHSRRRAAVVAQDADGARRALSALGRREPAPGLITGQANGSGRSAWVFSGQGMRWSPRGLQLAARFQAFDETLRRCDAVTQAEGGWSLRVALAAETLPAERASVIAQPAHVALQMSLAALLTSVGVRPNVVLGHSLGEVAAAQAAGALSVEQAMTIAVARGVALTAARGGGQMLSVSAPAETVSDLISTSGLDVVLAVDNGPSQVVVSAAADALRAFEAQLNARGLETRILHLDFMSHVPSLAGVAARFREAIAAISPQETTIALISSVTGDSLPGNRLTPDYWAEQLVRPVRFRQAFARLSESRPSAIVELSPAATLTPAMGDTLAEAGLQIPLTPLLSRGPGEVEQAMNVLGELYVAGDEIDWSALYPRPAGRGRVPAYPWRRTAYPTPTTAAAYGPAADGAHMAIAGEGRHIWQGRAPADLTDADPLGAWSELVRRKASAVFGAVDIAAIGQVQGSGERFQLSVRAPVGGVAAFELSSIVEAGATAPIVQGLLRQVEPASDDAPECEAVDPDVIAGFLSAQLAALLGAVPETEQPLIELGLDSIMAGRLAAKVRDRFGLALGLKDLLTDTTLADLTRLIAAAASAPSSAGPAGSPAPEPRAEDHTEQPASAAERLMWINSALDPERAAFNMAIRIDLDVAVEPTRLERALARLVDRHPALRRAYRLAAGEVRARTLPSYAPHLQVWSAANDAPAFEAELRQRARRPLDLARGEVLRAELAQGRANGDVLLLVVHHIAADNWGLEILLGDLGALYRAEPDARAPDLPDRPARRDLGSPVTDAETRQYWAAELAAPPAPLDLREDGRADLARLFAGDVVARDIAPALFSALQAAARAQHVTLFSMATAAVAAMLHGRTGARDMLVGTVVSIREAAEEQDVANLTNFVPLRLRQVEGPCAALAHRVHRAVTEMMPHAARPLGAILQDAGVAALGAAPYKVAVVTRGRFDAATWPGAKISPVSTDTAPLPLRFVLDTVDDLRPRLICEHQFASFSPQTAAEMLDQVVEALKMLAGALPASPVPPPKVRIAATFAAEPTTAALSAWLDRLDLPHTPQFAPLGQVVQQLLDPASLLNQPGEGCDLVLVRVEDLAGPWTLSGDPARGRMDIAHFAAAVRARASARPLRVVVCPPSPGIEAQAAAREWHDSLADSLRNALAAAPSTPCETWSGLTGPYACGALHDPVAFAEAKAPYTAEGYAALATLIARRLYGESAARRKVLVLDCDNTLWAGVLDEVGPDHVRLEPAHAALQAFAVQAEASGVLVCLCTRNRLEDVQAAFERHPEFPLRPHHIVAIRATWDVKADCLRDLARELDLGLDAFVFLDDDPAVCADVRHRAPQVLTLQFRGEGEAMTDHLWSLDPRTGTSEDGQRTNYYRQELARSADRAEAPSLEAFIRDLEVRVNLEAVADADLGRVAQLSTRTNQFNTTGLRLSEAQLRARLADDAERAVVAKVSDRLGDYGTVAALLLAMGPDALEVRAFYLSCRAMGRGVEHELLHWLARNAVDAGRSRLDFHYQATERNEPAGRFLAEIGAAPAGADQPGIWRVGCDRAFAARPAFEAPVSAPAAAERVRAVAAASESSHLHEAIAYDLARPQDVLASLQADRRRARPDALSEAAPLGDAAERLVARLWTQVLGVETVGADDDFVALGGNSLAALEFLSALAEETGQVLSIAELAQAPSLAAVADRVRRAPGGRAAQPVARLQSRPQDKDQPFPLSDIQQAYWVGRRDGVAYGGVGAHVYTELSAAHHDVAALERAWNQLIQRHEMLRCVVRDDGAQQVIEVPPYAIDRLDLTTATEAEAERQRAALRQRMSHQRLDPAGWPLFELKVSQTAQSSVLHISFDLLMADARSFQILLEEMRSLMQAPDQALPALGLSFRDIRLAEAERDGDEALRRAEDYWRARAPSLPAYPDLPVLRDRAAGPPRFGRRQTSVAPDRWAAINELARRRGLTPTSVLAATFAETIQAWARGPAFSLGLVQLSRPPAHPDIQRVVGDFTSVSLLECDTACGASLETRAAQVQGRIWRDLEHRDYTGVRLARDLRRLGSTALDDGVPVVFTSLLGVADMPDGEVPGLGRIAYQISQTPQVALDCQVRQEAGALLVAWDALEAHFAPGWLDEAFRVFTRRLDELARPEGWSCGLTFDPPAPTPGTDALAADLDLDAVLTQMEGPWAERPALISAQETLSFGAWARQARGLADAIAAAGVARNDRVAIAADRGPDQAIAVLAVLLAGGAYVPLDTSAPEARLSRIVDHSQARLVLVSDPHVPCGWRASTPILPIRGHTATRAGARAAQAADLAYVIYTSGSTGEPKGVMIERGAIANTLAAMNSLCRLGDADRLFAVSAFTFDLSVYDILGAFTTGAGIVFPAAAQSRNPTAWIELIRRHQATVWNSAPALMELVVEQLEARGGRLPEQLRLVLLSGDWIPVDLPDRIRRLGAAIEVVSLGGATEASIWSIYYPIGEVDPAWPSIPYGRPLPGQDLTVRDADLRRRPVWATGELYISGAGLARGYLAAPAETEARFLRDPTTGERLYRTGDLGRYLPSGDIEFLGRVDTQVKINGHRVELGEIEAALQACPGVRTAVAVLQPAADGRSHRLAAYLVAEVETLSLEAVKAALSRRLPAYMAPSVMQVLPSLPLTPNGKVDRKALAQLGDAAAPADPEPGDVQAEHLRSWVSDQLGVAVPHAGSNLFECGATSVDLIRLANRVVEVLGFEPDLEAFLNNPTIEGVLAARGAAVAPASPPAQELGMLLDPDARARFRSEVSRQSLFVDRPALTLARGAASAQRALRSTRTYDPGPVSAAQVAALLSVLARDAQDGPAAYSSAGGLYPVRCYLAVRPDRVASLDAGVHYYDPGEHALRLVAHEPPAAQIFGAPASIALFRQSAFAVFLVLHAEAITPLYGERSELFGALEAGAITHLLEDQAAACGLGLCQIGGANAELGARALRLGPTQKILHCLVGGGLPAAAAASALKRALAIVRRVSALTPDEKKALIGETAHVD